MKISGFPTLVVVAVLLSPAFGARQLLQEEGTTEGSGVLESIRFHFGGNFPPFDFLENTPEPESQAGFGVSFAKILCERFNISCEIIRDDYEECWTNAGFPGPGIYDGSYHGCSTYTHTYLRQTGVDFTHAYTRKQPAGILSRLDENGLPVVHPQDSDLKGAKIAVVAGWATNAGSLRYITNGCTDEKFTNYKVVTPKDKSGGPDAAFQALIDGQVDAVYAFSSTIDNRKACDQEGCDPELYQVLGQNYAWIHTGITEYQANGTTLAFTPKGSPLIDFLNPMIAEVLTTKDYADLCRDYDGEDIECFPNEHTKGPTKIVKGSLPDKARTAACESDADPEACNACTSGFCGCDVN